MGILFIGLCLCGYTTPELPEGCGTGRPGRCRVLVSCARCRAIRSTPMTPGPTHCPACGEPATLLEPEGEADDAVWSGQLWPCPRCGATELQLEPVGLWD